MKRFMCALGILAALSFCGLMTGCSGGGGADDGGGAEEPAASQPG